jgi:osmoprotectant transport system permease protein
VLRQVELPLAVGAIAVGVRSAAVQIVATATLGAIFGSGGLGRFLVEGIAQNDDGQIFGGVVLIAGLALLTEFAFATLQRLFESPGLRRAAVDSRSGAVAVPNT